MSRRVPTDESPSPGHNVYLSLDLDLQLVATRLLEGRRGAAVAQGVASAHPFYAARAENAELWDVEGGKHLRGAGLETPQHREEERASRMRAEALTLVLKQAEQNPDTVLQALSATAVAYLDSGRFEESLQLLRPAYELSCDLLPREHSLTIGLLGRLADAGVEGGVGIDEPKPEWMRARASSSSRNRMRPCRR